MKIDALEFNLFEIPFKRPFKAGCGTFDKKRSVLMKIQADGYVGYGECSALQAPFYSSECADTEYLIAEKFLAPHLVGQSFESPEELARSMNILVKGHPFAKQGIECAFWDAWSKQQGRSVQQLLGGIQRVGTQVAQVRRHVNWCQKTEPSAFGPQFAFRESTLNHEPIIYPFHHHVARSI